MTLNEYMQFTDVVSIYPAAGSGDILALSYVALGLNGEAGEIAEKIKKYIRDNTYDEAAVVKELGDVLFYWIRMCRELGVNPELVMQANVDKLTSRKERGVINGNGDNR